MSRDPSDENDEPREEIPLRARVEYSRDGVTWSETAFVPVTPWLSTSDPAWRDLQFDLQFEEGEPAPSTPTKPKK